MRSNGFEFEVLVHGRPVAEFHHEGNTFLEGRKGSEFKLRIHNGSSRRVCVVLSVDGLSVMNGKTATREDAGYILEPYGSMEVPGWRLDNKEVAKFIFADLPKAYAAQMGTPTNIGVMGAVFYRERRQEPVFQSLTLGHTFGGPVFRGATRGGTLGGSVSKGVGTGFGAKTEHAVRSVNFERESTPAAELVLRYDDATGLEARGIVITTSHKEPDRVVAANPFPADKGCQPPPNWRG